MKILIVLIAVAIEIGLIAFGVLTIKNNHKNDENND